MITLTYANPVSVDCRIVYCDGTIDHQHYVAYFSSDGDTPCNCPDLPDPHHDCGGKQRRSAKPKR